VAGVYFHGRAGDFCKERKGERGIVAGDLIEAIPDIISSFE
jgi:NAD(P)H-hydrate epimerase